VSNFQINAFTSLKRSQTSPSNCPTRQRNIAGFTSSLPEYGCGTAQPPPYVCLSTMIDRELVVRVGREVKISFRCSAI
jgi:hypothetical protein